MDLNKDGVLDIANPTALGLSTAVQTITISGNPGSFRVTFNGAQTGNLCPEGLSCDPLRGLCVHPLGQPDMGRADLSGRFVPTPLPAATCDQRVREIVLGNNIPRLGCNAPPVAGLYLVSGQARTALVISLR